MALAYRVPIITTVSGALATSTAIEKLKSCTEVRALQDFFNVDLQKDNSKNLLSASSSL
jgi:carbamoyl-phosphate synthase large subunit